MIEQDNEKISIRQQCKLLEINRSSLYYKQKPISAETLNIMNLVDEIYTRYPFYGKRRMRAHLEREKGISIGLEKIRTIYQKLGLEAIYPKPKLSLRNKEHKIYPYLTYIMHIFNILNHFN